MPNIELTLLIGQYAQGYYLEGRKKSLSETVRSFEDYLPNYFPLVHPSPRNGIWMRKNPWFEEEVLPELQKIVHNVLNQ
jgi:uracil-DNA glycosylase